jgi:hypothetical protein
MNIVEPPKPIIIELIEIDTWILIIKHKLN